MKYLKTYKVFENWNTLPSESVFLEISDTLQEIFDEFDIPFIDEEEIDAMSERGEDTFIKHWEWSYDYDGKMCQINILFLDRPEMNRIYNKLKEINPVIKARTGWTLHAIHEYDDDPTIDKDHLILKPVR